MTSRPGLISRPEGMAPRPAARTRVRPEPQPTSSRRVPRVTWAASRTASNRGRLWGSARSAQVRGSVPHRRRWTSAAALIMRRPARGRPSRRSRLAVFAQRGQAAVHAGDDVVVLVELDGMREQRAAVVPGDRDRAGSGGVDQPAARAVPAGRSPAPRSGTTQETWLIAPGVTRYAASETVVDRVDLAELDHDRSPGGEGRRVVEHDVVAGPAAGGRARTPRTRCAR